MYPSPFEKILISFFSLPTTNSDTASKRAESGSIAKGMILNVIYFLFYHAFPRMSTPFAGIRRKGID